MISKRIAVLAALAAGTVLLTACGTAATNAGDTSTRTASDARQDISADGDEPVDCGEVKVDGATHMVTAEPSSAGIVGCTEAFNVLDEYLTIPAAERGAALNGTELSDGWSCTTDDGETASIGCVKGKAGNDYELAFSTKPV